MRLEAAQPWPVQGGAALGVPLSLKPWAQPHPTPPPTGILLGPGMAGFSAAAQGTGYPGHEGGGRERERGREEGGHGRGSGEGIR